MSIGLHLSGETKAKVLSQSPICQARQYQMPIHSSHMLDHQTHHSSQICQTQWSISRYNELTCVALGQRFNSHSTSLSLCSPLICGVNYVCESFSTTLYQFFLVGLPAYFSNHSMFSREHIFVGINRFPSLVSPSASTESQVQLSTPRLTAPDPLNMN